MKKAFIIWAIAAVMVSFAAGCAARAESNKGIEAALSQAEALEAKGLLIDAKAAYEKVLNDHSDSPLAGDAQRKLGDINIRLLFSSIQTKDSTIYKVVPGDSIAAIARRFGTTAELIQKSNNITMTLRAGAVLKVSTAKFSILVDKSQNRLFLKNGEEIVKVYTVSTGKDSSLTPIGAFKITNKLPNPVWYKDGKAIPPESPENILGTRWLGISKQGYGIHGTTEPQTIGQSVTAGCVRMINNEVEELFSIVPVGTDVTIID